MIERGGKEEMIERGGDETERNQGIDIREIQGIEAERFERLYFFSKY